MIFRKPYYIIRDECTQEPKYVTSDYKELNMLMTVRKPYYIIRDECTQEPKYVTSDYKELNILITGIFSGDFYYDIVDRKEAKETKKELSDKTKI